MNIYVMFQLYEKQFIFVFFSYDHQHNFKHHLNDAWHVSLFLINHSHEFPFKNSLNKLFDYILFEIHLCDDKINPQVKDHPQIMLIRY